MTFNTDLSFGTLDGADFLTVWGIAVENGTDTFKAFYQPKERFTKKWADQDGTEFNLQEVPKKEARIFSLECWLLGNSVTDFNSKYNNFQDVFFLPGYRTIFCKKYGVTVKVILKSFPKNVESPKYTKFQGNNFFGVQFTIEFEEVII